MRKIVFTLLVIFLAVGCAGSRMDLPEIPKPPPPKKNPALDYRDIKKHSYRERNNVPSNWSRYEGSLWQDESSWGNLLRDHRARFKNDVITISDLHEIISVPKKEDKVQPQVPLQTGLATAGEEQADKIGKALDAINAAANQQVDDEEEQNDVLRALKTISARVTNVMQNGNMVILGEKVDYRQQNNVRYVTTIKGIIRPEDVSDKNEISSLKLARSEVKIKRQILSNAIKLKSLSPIIGKKKAGLMDKLSHIATPKKNNKTTTVNQK